MATIYFTNLYDTDNQHKGIGIRITINGKRYQNFEQSNYIPIEGSYTLPNDMARKLRECLECNIETKEPKKKEDDNPIKALQGTDGDLCPS